MGNLVAEISNQQVLFFSFSLLLTFVLLVALSFFGYWLTHQAPSLSPYTKYPLRMGSDLPYDSVERILRYLYSYHEYDNRMFDLRKAAYCRDTGRVFPDALTWYGVIKVDWNFLQKRYPGNYVSWGSLTDLQKEIVKESHHSLEGFEIDYSCPNPIPRMIEPEYALSKPGPLYVDIETKVLLGWKLVPDTDFEVLIVQKPKDLFEIPMT